MTWNDRIDATSRLSCVTSCGSFLKALLYEFIILIANGLHYAVGEDSSALLQVRCHCISGWCVWKDVEWAVYTESTNSVCCCV